MYKKNKHIHFMGIGGIGMSGIAAILKQQGYIVSGCDTAKESDILQRLSKLGCKIHCGHCNSHVKTADVLVYSSAINSNSIEILAALEKGIPVVPRAIMLAELMRMKYGIAISGSHGKTTTTSMISHILIEAKLDPTIIIGGILKNLSTQAKLGSGDLLIAEADESDRSLLYLNPSIAIVTNIDAEHLDTYHDLADVKQTFKDFLARLPFYGRAVVCIDNENIRSILPLPHIQTIKYGFSRTADVRGKLISLDPASTTFSVYEKKHFIGTITMAMPGEHNVLNALAAIALSLELEVSFSIIKTALESFKGVERRFEFKGTYNGADIFDDYGHHPTEIQKTLLVAQNHTKKKLFVVFQPHRYTRTQKLWNDFVHVLAYGGIDILYLTDIYSASETPIPGITSQKLAAAIQAKNPELKVYFHKTYDAIQRNVEKQLKSDDLFITIGAGKANCIGNALQAKNSGSVS